MIFVAMLIYQVPFCGPDYYVVKFIAQRMTHFEQIYKWFIFFGVSGLFTKISYTWSNLS